MSHKNTILQFWERVDQDPELGCLLWNRNLMKDGYVTWNVDGRSGVLAHRWAYEQFFGEPQQTIHHKCWRRHCVHPFHLEDLSHADNCRRALAQREREAEALNLAEAVVNDPSQFNLSALSLALTAVRMKDLVGAPSERFSIDELKRLCTP